MTSNHNITTLRLPPLENSKWPRTITLSSLMIVTLMNYSIISSKKNKSSTILKNLLINSNKTQLSLFIKNNSIISNKRISSTSSNFMKRRSNMKMISLSIKMMEEMIMINSQRGNLVRNNHLSDSRWINKMMSRIKH